MTKLLFTSGAVIDCARTSAKKQLENIVLVASSTHGGQSYSVIFPALSGRNPTYPRTKVTSLHPKIYLHLREPKKVIQITYLLPSRLATIPVYMYSYNILSISL